MSDPARFLTALSQAVATAALYGESHPASARADEAAYRELTGLQGTSRRLEFTFLPGEVVFGDDVLPELRTWEWGTRLAAMGLQRLEFEAGVSLEEFRDFLGDVTARIAGRGELRPSETAEARPGARVGIRFGSVGLRGAARAPSNAEIKIVTVPYTLREESVAVAWLHREVESRRKLPLLEAEAVVRSLSVAMHAQQGTVVPLLQLKEFDEYTTTHCVNVAVLSMALTEFLGLGATHARAFGVAGLLHDLGKVRVPRDILLKPGKLTDEERAVMQAHPVDGARLILAVEENLDLAAMVAYEHHIMLDGGGYPCPHFPRDTHYGSRLVHVCDVYDALRTRRPYRDAWESERALQYIEERAGNEFDPDIASAFGRMMRQWDQVVLPLAG